MSSRAGIAEVVEVSLLEVQLEHGQDPFPANSPWVAAGKPPAFAIKPCELDCHLLLTELVEKHSIDANFQDAASGKILLAVASANGSGKCVTVLLSHGADPNKQLRIRDSEWSPLHLAAQYGHTAICRQLLDAGASLDTVILPVTHFTPLHVAAVSGHVDVILLLMQRGANTRATNQDGCTPIFVACIDNQLQSVKALLPDADLGHLDSRSNSLLHAAVLRGGAALQAVLPRYAAAGLVDIPSGVPHPSMPNNATASTPLMIACRHAKHAEVKLLLAAGALRYTRDSKGEDALHHAIVGTSLLCCRLILGTAPNWHYTPQQLSETNAAGRNALFAVVQAGLTEVCKMLIAAGMDRGNVHPSGLPSVYMFCDPEDRSIIGGLRGSTVRTFHDLALHYWPRRHELADLFDPHGVPQPLAPPCCANCKTSDINLSACSKCHAAVRLNLGRGRMREQQDTERPQASSSGTENSMTWACNTKKCLTVRSPVSCSRASRGPPGSFEGEAPESPDGATVTGGIPPVQ